MIQKRNRRGFTLIEVGIASTVSSLLAALGIGLIYGLISANSSMKTQVDAQRTIARLAETLRADAHRAETAKIEDNDSEIKRLVLKQDANRSVEYTLADGGIVRQVHDGEKRIAGDSFLLPPETTFEVSLESAGEKTLVVLELGQTPEKKSGKRDAPVIAAIGTSPATLEVSLPVQEEATSAAEENPAEEKAEPESEEEAEQ